jgi:glycerol uptake facilitator-like aquaporin
MAEAVNAGPLPQQQASLTRPAVRLHGHRLDHNMARAVTADALSTFLLVLAITSAAVAAALARPVAGAPYGSLAVATSSGPALAALVAGLGHMSGAHLKPAVTLGLAASGRFLWTCVWKESAGHER